MQDMVHLCSDCIFDAHIVPFKAIYLSLPQKPQRLTFSQQEAVPYLSATLFETQGLRLVFEEIPNDLAQLALSSTGYRQVFEEPLVRASKELDSGWRVSQALQYGKSYRLVIEVDQTQIDEVSTNYNDEVTFTLKIEVSARQARDLKSHSPSE
jgi:hypothetical protein